MFVKPQNKERDARKEPTKDVVLDRLTRYESFVLKDRSIFGRTPGEPTFCLGRYITHLRAAEVFKELEQAIMEQRPLFKMPAE